jgi:hypothetical protein
MKRVVGRWQSPLFRGQRRAICRVDSFLGATVEMTIVGRGMRACDQRNCGVRRVCRTAGSWLARLRLQLQRAYCALSSREWCYVGRPRPGPNRPSLPPFCGEGAPCQQTYTSTWFYAAPLLLTRANTLKSGCTRALFCFSYSASLHPCLIYLLV